MKTLTAILPFVALPLMGQTNLPAPVITTNLVTAHYTFREVNGQLYNTERSELFEDIQAELLESKTNLLICRTFNIKKIYGRVYSDSLTSGGNFLGSSRSGPSSPPVIGTKKEYGKVIALSNYPAANTVTIDQTVDCRALKVGVYNYDDKPIPLYDRGMPHIVPVVVTNYPRTSAESPTKK